ncbi:hemopexin [Spea bombifrons]|uniref:hemopexin n=1 Tax=Spea bombifrons TaxID=233779 RepID=UPI00234949C0|nr:hemopexin [Spea bombifrons]
MKMARHLAVSVFICLLSLGVSYPLIKGKPDDKGSNRLHINETNTNATDPADRCAEEGFGAMTLDDQGVMHYFRDSFVWTGFRGKAQYINETWPGLTGPVDAAFRIHNKEQPQLHQRTYVFKGSRVWSFFEGRPVSGYPRPISQEFPGVPDNLDAAVECHSGECKTDSVIFFKGGKVYIYSPHEVPPVKERRWSALGNCTAAVRWLERYYCFKGTNFTRFDPVSGEVLSPRLLDTRDYFVSCPGRGHGEAAMRNATFASIKNRCSGRPFEAFSSDDKGRTYAFRGGWYFRVDSSKDGWHAWPLNHTWRTLQGPVDTVFNWENKMYFIQGSQVIIYLTDQIYVPVLGYPKSLQEELGLTEVDAAFTCPLSSELYVIKGNKLQMVDLKKTPRVPGEEKVIAHTQVDSAMCNTHGIYLFQGPVYYHYLNVGQLLTASQWPKPGNISVNFFDC